MVPILNISIALIVFMGLVSGGMLALVLMTTRRYQVSFSAILGIALLLALAGIFSAVSFVGNPAEGLTNAIVLLILAFGLGYTLTTFSVLSTQKQRRGPLRPGEDDFTAVICLAPGEPPSYGVDSASRRLSFADDAQDVPPVLLRPFYLRDLRGKYAAIGRSPYRDYYNELAQKVQSRLDSSHRVYMAFYNDNPILSQVVHQAVDKGARRIVLVHLRVTDPPDVVASGVLMEGLRPENYGVKMAEIGPLWNSDLLAQIYVRRVLEAAPQVSMDSEDIGLLLVGRGHSTTGDKGGSSSTRYNEERQFQEKVRQALVKIGFDASHVAVGWLRWNTPSAGEALRFLAAEGCKHVFWMPSSFPAEGIITLYDIPTELEPVAKSTGVKLSSLGAWNADDLAAEDIAGRVRAVSDQAPSPAASRGLRSL